jgi:hypothetical protein
MRVIVRRERPHPGAQLRFTEVDGRRLRVRLAERWPWAREITAAITRLQALPTG